MHPHFYTKLVYPSLLSICTFEKSTNCNIFSLLILYTISVPVINIYCSSPTFQQVIGHMFQSHLRRVWNNLIAEVRIILGLSLVSKKIQPRDPTKSP